MIGVLGGIAFAFLFSFFVFDIFTLRFLPFECGESTRRGENMRIRSLFFCFAFGHFGVW